jgi:pimeloyl-ACP methyl ester carboxylesterase
MTTRIDHQGQPHLIHSLTEWRALLELAVLPYTVPWLMTAPRGDGHPVLLLPGFMADEGTLAPLKMFLRQRGYDVQTWGFGRNVGFQPQHAAALEQKIRYLHHQSGRTVSLVGWSLGGVYARELAKQLEAQTRCVITLGSPFSGHVRATNAARAYELYSGKPLQQDPARAERLKRAPPVPTTSIYSKTDGVVAWQCSLNEDAAHTENIEIHASHLGLGVNPLALYAVADRLRQDPAHWKRFAPQAVPRWLFRGAAPQRTTKAAH